MKKILRIITCSFFFIVLILWIMWIIIANIILPANDISLKDKKLHLLSGRFNSKSISFKLASEEWLVLNNLEYRLGKGMLIENGFILNKKGVKLLVFTDCNLYSSLVRKNRRLEIKTANINLYKLQDIKSFFSHFPKGKAPSTWPFKSITINKISVSDPFYNKLGGNFILNGDGDTRKINVNLHGAYDLSIASSLTMPKLIDGDKFYISFNNKAVYTNIYFDFLKDNWQLNGAVERKKFSYLAKINGQVNSTLKSANINCNLYKEQQVSGIIEAGWATSTLYKSKNIKVKFKNIDLNIINKIKDDIDINIGGSLNGIFESTADNKGVILRRLDLQCKNLTLKGKEWNFTGGILNLKSTFGKEFKLQSNYIIPRITLPSLKVSTSELGGWIDANRDVQGSWEAKGTLNLPGNVSIDVSSTEDKGLVAELINKGKPAAIVKEKNGDWLWGLMPFKTADFDLLRSFPFFCNLDCIRGDGEISKTLNSGIVFFAGGGSIEWGQGKKALKSIKIKNCNISFPNEDIEISGLSLETSGKKFSNMNGSIDISSISTKGGYGKIAGNLSYNNRLISVKDFRCDMSNNIDVNGNLSVSFIKPFTVRASNLNLSYAPIDLLMKNLDCNFSLTGKRGIISFGNTIIKGINFNGGSFSITDDKNIWNLRMNPISYEWGKIDELSVSIIEGKPPFVKTKFRDLESETAMKLSFLWTKLPFTVKGGKMDGTVDVSASHGVIEIQPKLCSVNLPDEKHQIRKVEGNFLLKWSDNVITLNKSHFKAENGLNVFISGEFPPSGASHIAVETEEAPSYLLRDALFDFIPETIGYGSFSGNASLKSIMEFSKERQFIEARVQFSDSKFVTEDKGFKMAGINGTLILDISLLPSQQGIPGFQSDIKESFAREWGSIEENLNGEPLYIKRLALGFMSVNNLSIYQNRKSDMNSFSFTGGDLFGGKIIGEGTLQISSSGFTHSMRVSVKDLNLSRLSYAMKGEKSYLSGLVQGGIVIKADRLGLDALKGITEIWVTEDKNEKMKLSKRFLEDIGGEKIKGLVSGKSLSYDIGELKCGLSDGYITIYNLRLENYLNPLKALMRKDISFEVKLPQSHNRIRLKDLIDDIKRISSKGDLNEK